MTYHLETGSITFLKFLKVYSMDSIENVEQPIGAQPLPVIEDKPRANVTGPGEILLKARLQKGYSDIEVAEQMHLPVSVVRAIEEDSYEKIKNHIFIKGYIRSYAKIVEVSGDDVIGAISFVGLN